MYKIPDFKIPDRLNLDTDWSIGETAFERIATTLLQMSPVEILTSNIPFQSDGAIRQKGNPDLPEPRPTA